jgi:hypothetical protein
VWAPWRTPTSSAPSSQLARCAPCRADVHRGLCAQTGRQSGVCVRGLKGANAIVRTDRPPASCTLSTQQSGYAHHKWGGAKGHRGGGGKVTHRHVRHGHSGIVHQERTPPLRKNVLTRRNPTSGTHYPDLKQPALVCSSSSSSSNSTPDSYHDERIGVRP